ncbi:hypothetical protein PILCRDRAFT_827821 [Piloderma croceum F 1598]|uniref:Uncharacterized protein n=1 Tax=Piloderma croceum (strain F 1598) TaxID=765440 RepID=A0A0C3ALW6_PILCF|nr:hypothetical protein PILCRDRAFT_827821 [Piloderma croceum F 1598]
MNEYLSSNYNLIQLFSLGSGKSDLRLARIRHKSFQPGANNDISPMVIDAKSSHWSQPF